MSDVIERPIERVTREEMVKATRKMKPGRQLDYRK